MDCEIEIHENPKGFCVTASCPKCKKEYSTGEYDSDEILYSVAIDMVKREAFACCQNK